MGVEHGHESRRSSRDCGLVIHLEPGDASAPANVNGMSSHRADGDRPGREDATRSRAEIPCESHVTADEAHRQKVLVFGIDLLADEEQQRDLASVVRDEAEL